MKFVRQQTISPQVGRGLPALSGEPGVPGVASLDRVSLRDRLRHETRAAHEQLERDLDLLSPGLTQERYRHLIERFYGFYAPWEQHVEGVMERALPGFFAPRRKVPLLLADLRALGSDAATLPLCRTMPPAGTLAQVLGGLYVIEGSTLGGQILSRHLSLMLGPAPASFFRSYGESVGPMWRSFLATLAAHASPDTDNLVIEAASETFATLHDWLLKAER